MAGERLHEAITAVKSGHAEEARRILLDLVAVEPHHELAWLWLSELLTDVEDRIIALENALELNPHRRQTQIRLLALRQQWDKLSADPVAQAQQMQQDGRFPAAYTLLQTHLQLHPNDAAAWFLLSQLTGSREDQIVTLEQVIRRQPGHVAAWQRLTQLLKTGEDALALGRAYETVGDLAAARRMYRLARLEADGHPTRVIAEKRYRDVQKSRPPSGGSRLPPLPQDARLIWGRLYEEAGEWVKAQQAYQVVAETAVSAQERHIASQRHAAVQAQMNQPPVKISTPSQTLFRLALGPLFLYLLLWVGHHGWRLGHPLWLGVGLTAVFGGASLGTLLSVTPHHPWGQTLWGTANQIDRLAHALVHLLSFLLIVAPFALLLLSALERLSSYVPVLPTLP